MFSNRSNTSKFGCPNLLFFPTPIKAIPGFTASKKFLLEEVFEP